MGHPGLQTQQNRKAACRSTRAIIENAVDVEAGPTTTKQHLPARRASFATAADRMTVHISPYKNGLAPETRDFIAELNAEAAQESLKVTYIGLANKIEVTGDIKGAPELRQPGRLVPAAGAERRLSAGRGGGFAEGQFAVAKATTQDRQAQINRRTLSALLTYILLRRENEHLSTDRQRYCRRQALTARAKVMSDRRRRKSEKEPPKREPDDIGFCWYVSGKEVRLKYPEDENTKQ